jgi:hypothetical protein
VVCASKVETETEVRAEGVGHADVVRVLEVVEDVLDRVVVLEGELLADVRI